MVQGSGGLTVVTVKETISTQVIPPPSSQEKSAALPRGQKRVVQPGKAGARRVRWEVTMHNDREVARRPLSAEITLEPQARKALIGVGKTGG